MIEKKKQAFLQAAKKLLGQNTPEEDIGIALIELGLSDEEAKKIIQEAKNGSKETPQEKPSKTSVTSTPENDIEKPEKQMEPVKKEMGVDLDLKREKAILETTKKIMQSKTLEQDIIESLKEMGLSREEAKKTIQQAKQSSASDAPSPPEIKEAIPEKVVEEPKQQMDILKSFMKKEEIKEKPIDKPKSTKEKTFIPNLKKDGLSQVEEIIEESPLDMKKEEKETIATKKLDATQLDKEVEKEETGLKSSLDSLETQIEKGGKIEDVKIETKKKTINIEKNSDLTILIIPNKEYNDGLSVLLKKMGKSYNKILYVNLNELYNSLIYRIRSLKLNTEKFFFVDAITMTSDRNLKKHDNCIYISSPNSLIELSLGITQAINTQNPDALIFDSLSTLLIYEKDSTVTKFIHSLIGKIKAARLDSFFTALEGDAQNEAIKNLSMFVNRVITLTEFELEELGFKPGITPRGMSEISVSKQKIKKPQRMEKEINQQLATNRIVTQEMNELKQRLGDMQNNKELVRSLDELKGKMGKVEELKTLQEQVKKIAEKLDQKQEQPVNKTVDKAILTQITRLEKKIDSMQKSKPTKIVVKENKEVKNAIKSLKEKIRKTENLTNLELEVKSLTKKLESKKEKPLDNRVVDQITKLSNKIDSLEKKVSKKMREKQIKKEHFDLKQKMEVYKKQIELQSMMEDFYGTDITKINPKKVMTRDLEQKLEKKKNFLTKAYKKKLISKNMYAKGAKRVTKETDRLKHSAEIHSLEQKLNVLNEAYDSGVISNESYSKGKMRIEKLLKK